VAIGVTISTERLNEIKSKLDLTRAIMAEPAPTKPLLRNGNETPKENH
jgi:hypothetical protein